MSDSITQISAPIRTALIIVDAQESFRHRPYWQEDDVPGFVDRLQALIDGAQAQGIPIVQIFHVEPAGVFSHASGFVTAMAPLRVEADAIFEKRRHSALVDSGLEAWLVQHGIRRVIVSGIRSEQCCETTARHASDIGYEVDYVTEATLTFPMTDQRGRTWSADEIKARTELVLDGRFAQIVTADEALARAATTAAPAAPPGAAAATDQRSARPTSSSTSAVESVTATVPSRSA